MHPLLPLSRLSPLLLLVVLLAVSGCSSSPAPAASVASTAPAMAATAVPTTAPTTVPPTASDTPRPVAATPPPTVPPAPTRAATAAVTRVVPTAVPTRVYASGSPKYLWPTDTRGSFIRPGLSWANDKAFFLATTNNPPEGFAWALHGGAKSEAARLANLGGRFPTTVRGHPAMFTGNVLYWEEDGQPYAIQGVTDQKRAEAIAEALEEVPLGTWQARVADVGTPRAPNSRLLYFWPTWLPKDVRIFRDSTITYTDEGLRYKLLAGGGDKRTVGLDAGPQGDFPTFPEQGGQAVPFRGGTAWAYSNKEGMVLKWEENGVTYMITALGFTVGELIDVINGLEEVDLATWRQRVTDLP